MLKYSYPKGRILAKGFYFNSQGSLQVFKQQVFKLWSSSTKMYKLDHGYVILLEKEEPCFVDNVQSVPLIKQFNGYSNVFWESTKHLVSSNNTQRLWLLQQGKVVTIDLYKDKQFSPSLWINLENYKNIEMKTLGEIKKTKIIKQQKENSVRKILKDKDLKESEKLEFFLDKLEEIKKSGQVKDKRRGIDLGTIFSSLKSIFKFSSQSNQSDGPLSSRNADPKKYQKNSNQESGGILSRIRSAFSQIVMASALGKAIGRVQAKYIHKLMEQLVKGDLDEALRNAIPLSNLQDALKANQAKLGKISGVNSFNINPHSVGSSSSVSLEDDVINKLRTMYEAAFNKMDREGKYKKAAFILAELLRDIDRAVQYLEKHEQFVLAAELAEGQNLQPSRVIRQWILAGDIQRAMQIAVVSGCFEQAITALEGSHKKEANILRWNIAQLHYQARNFQTAIDIAWPLTDKREKVISWLKDSYRSGGQMGARHLVRLALNDEENYQHYLCEIDNVLKNQISHNSIAIYQEIINQGEGKNNSRIASLASRAYLLDVACQKINHDSKVWNNLCKLAGDLTLRADTRNLAFGSELNKTALEKLTTATETTFDESYGRKAFDCVVLHNGDVLVSFGESGVERWSAKGSRIDSCPVPCHSIVLNDAGTQALLIAQRSGYQVVSKYDVNANKAQHWLDLNINSWANSYDGTRWIIGIKDSVLILDTHSNDQTALWSVTDLKGSLISIERTDKHFAFYLAFGEHFELWSYELPNLYLKERTPYQHHTLKNIEPIAFGANGLLAGLNPENERKYALYRQENTISWNTLELDEEIIEIKLTDNWLIILTRFDDIVAVHIHPVYLNKPTKRVRSLRFVGAGDVNMRFFDQKLVVNHSDGRIVITDLKYGEIHGDFII